MRRALGGGHVLYPSETGPFVLSIFQILSIWSHLFLAIGDKSCCVATGCVCVPKQSCSGLVKTTTRDAINLWLKQGGSHRQHVAHLSQLPTAEIWNGGKCINPCWPAEVKGQALCSLWWEESVDYSITGVTGWRRHRGTTFMRTETVLLKAGTVKKVPHSCNVHIRGFLEFSAFLAGGIGYI